MQIEREPVVLANMIAAAVSAVLVALVALGYLPWNEGQQAAVVGAVIAITNVVAAVWARAQVTPMTDPRDFDGTPLVRWDE